MKVTNFALINIVNTLSNYENKKLPQKIGYAIVRNMQTVSKEYVCYEKQLNKIFKEFEQYMVKDDNGEIIYTTNGLPVVNDIVKEEFNKQIEELLNIEINIDMFHIEIDSFNYDDNGRFDALSPKDIITLQSLLCDKR